MDDKTTLAAYLYRNNVTPDKGPIYMCKRHQNKHLYRVKIKCVVPTCEKTSGLTGPLRSDYYVGPDYSPHIPGSTCLDIICRGCRKEVWKKMQRVQTSSVAECFLQSLVEKPADAPLEKAEFRIMRNLLTRSNETTTVIPRDRGGGVAIIVPTFTSKKRIPLMPGPRCPLPIPGQQLQLGRWFQILLKKQSKCCQLAPQREGATSVVRVKS